MKMPGILKRFLDAGDPTTDVKLASFGVVVVASIVWLSFDLGRNGIHANWVQAFYGLCALVGLGGSAWAAVDKWKASNTPPAAPPTKEETK